MDGTAAGRLAYCLVLLELALLPSCLRDGEEEGAVETVLLAVCADWWLSALKDIASEESRQKLVLV